MESVISTDSLKPVIAAKVRLLRKQAGMSQQQLAEQLGVSPLTILRLENGQTEPGAALLYSISDLFSVPADSLRQVSEKSAIPA